ncbi:hypothetical protein AJ79_05101 [Helicocarpus griseus UAMH5409]|uniref:Uncharacterized protein n=1 Tax=Helicocarpus griseus UAMH5409 TaxID=1447875 RepID=A0A2B7XQ26_9EURO|nr:hypothetical protein AJ79_05101 [Helicocarpus griseus UAMH5409]
MGSKRKKMRINWRNWTPKRIWQRLDLDTYSVLMMMKGGLAPTIVVAIHQSSAVADITENYAYLAVLMAVISQTLRPRAMFVKIMLFNLIATGMAAGLSTLGMYSAIQARKHTTPPDASEAVKNGHNSSQCAVAAIWLIFDIWLSNTLRNYRPTELQNPMVAFSMYVAVLMTRAANVATMSRGLIMVKQITLAFIIGFLIASGVSLFIIPVASRDLLFQSLKAYPATVNSLLNAQIAYVKRSKKDGPWKLTRASTLTRQGTFDNMLSRQATAARQGQAVPQDKRAQALRTAMNRLNSLHSNMHAQLYYAKQEVALGKLTSEDLDCISTLLRAILVSLSGIGMLPEIFRKLSRPIEQSLHVYSEPPGEGPGSSSESEDFDYPEQHFIGTLCDRLEIAAELVALGLQHSMITLGVSRPKDFAKDVKKRRLNSDATDEEAIGDMKRPGCKVFTPYFERRMQEFFDQKSQLPETWASLNAFTSVAGLPRYQSIHGQEDREIRKEFFVIILIGHLQELLLRATFDLIRFADSKVADGTMSTYKFIFPKREAIREWMSFQKSEEEEGEDKHTGSVQTVNPQNITGQHDPDHLPPSTSWQRFGDRLRRVARILSSEQSGFGLRVAIASFCPAILAFLRQTQDVFYNHRLNWAVIIVILAMSPTSGKSLFGLVIRIFATIASMVLSLIVWYIVAGKTPGVIVFLYVANTLQNYFVVKYPAWIPSVIIALITFNLIISYEIQNQKLGEVSATAGGLDNFPIYIFGPYRLAAVAAGCVVAFIWVIFPYPISASSQVRRCLGRSLFVLANFYSCMHTTIEVWIQQEQGDFSDEQSPGRVLERERMKLFSEEIKLLATMRDHSEYSLYEPPIGGPFPKFIYDNIATEIQAILSSMDIMSFATRDLESMTPRSFSQSRASSRHRRRSSAGGDEEDEEERWIDTLAKAADTPDFHSQLATSVLCHLSAAVTNGLSLPPYLSPPHPFPLARRLRKMNEGSLDISNIEDPAFSAFVSIEVMSSIVSTSLKNLMSNVKKLVGELNFDVYIQPHREMVRSRQSSRGVDGSERRRWSNASENEKEEQDPTRLQVP